MSDLRDWPRPYYEPDGGEALLWYQLFGNLPEDFKVDGQKYGVSGVPRGAAIDEYDRATQPLAFEILDDKVISSHLDELGPRVSTAVRVADCCVLFHGVVGDQPTLNYLRDAVGLVQYMLDKGCVAVLDTQTLSWFTRETWRENLFEPGDKDLGRHVVIMQSEDEQNADRLWLHTRGMRKFGRPDLSVRNVETSMAENAIDLCNRMIEHQARGHVVPEVKEIKMDGLPAGIVCRHAGAIEDPDFNNVHVEIVLPGKCVFLSSRRL